MDDRTFFLVVGSKEMLRLAGADKAHVISSDKGYTVKNVLSSNTFIIKSGNRYTKAKYLLDLVENPLDLEAIYNSLPSNSVWSISSVLDIQTKFYLGDNQVKAVERELKLLRTNDGHTRINYGDILKIVCYMNSIRKYDDFYSKMDTYPPHIRTWALSNFKGDPDEIGLYCLLDCYHRDSISIFLDTWRGLVLDEVDVTRLIELVKTTFLTSKCREEILKHLNDLLVKP